MKALQAAAFLLASGLVAQAATLEIAVQNIESSDGYVAVAVCATGFDPAGCPYGGRKPARAGEMIFRFEGVPSGRYAVAAYHDVNGNGKLDTYAFGIPSEPYGFSNEVGRTGPPDFQRALVAIGDSMTRVTVHLRRLSLGD